MVDIIKIKKLRKLTSCPIMECKRALEEAEGDIPKAVKKLKGVRPIKAGKQKNGRIGVIETDKDVFVAVLRCQTDFAANSEEVKDCLAGALENHSDRDIINEMEDHLQAIIKEDVTIEVFQFSKHKRMIGYYLHFDNRKIGVAYVYKEVEADFCKNMAMQVVAYPYFDIEEFCSTDYIKEPTVTIGELLEEHKVDALYYDYFEV